MSESPTEMLDGGADLLDAALAVDSCGGHRSPSVVEEITAAAEAGAVVDDEHVDVLDIAKTVNNDTEQNTTSPASPTPPQDSRTLRPDIGTEPETTDAVDGAQEMEEPEIHTDCTERLREDTVEVTSSTANTEADNNQVHDVANISQPVAVENEEFLMITDEDYSRVETTAGTSQPLAIEDEAFLSLTTVTDNEDGNVEDPASISQSVAIEDQSFASLTTVTDEDDIKVDDTADIGQQVAIEDQSILSMTMVTDDDEHTAGSSQPVAIEELAFLSQSTCMDEDDSKVEDPAGTSRSVAIEDLSFSSQSTITDEDDNKVEEILDVSQQVAIENTSVSSMKMVSDEADSKVEDTADISQLVAIEASSSQSTITDENESEVEDTACISQLVAITDETFSSLPAVTDDDDMMQVKTTADIRLPVAIEDLSFSSQSTVTDEDDSEDEVIADTIQSDALDEPVLLSQSTVTDEDDSKVEDRASISQPITFEDRVFSSQSTCTEEDDDTEETAENSTSNLLADIAIGTSAEPQSIVEADSKDRSYAGEQTAESAPSQHPQNTEAEASSAPFAVSPLPPTKSSPPARPSISDNVEPVRPALLTAAPSSCNTSTVDVEEEFEDYNHQPEPLLEGVLSLPEDEIHTETHNNHEPEPVHEEHDVPTESEDMLTETDVNTDGCDVDMKSECMMDDDDMDIEINVDHQGDMLDKQVNDVNTGSDGGGEYNGNDGDDDDDEADDVDVEDESDDNDVVPSSALRFSGKQMHSAFASENDENDDGDEDDDDYDDEDDEDDDADGGDERENDLTLRMFNGSENHLPQPSAAAYLADGNVQKTPPSEPNGDGTITSRIPSPTRQQSSVSDHDDEDDISSGVVPLHQHPQTPAAAVVSPSFSVTPQLIDNADAELTLSVPHSPEPTEPQQQLTPNISSSFPGTTSEMQLITAAANISTTTPFPEQTPQQGVFEKEPLAEPRLNGFAASNDDDDNNEDANMSIEENATINSQPQLLPPPPSVLPPPNDPNSLRSPSSFRSTDDMKFYLKQKLQYSDMGTLFKNVHVSTMAAANTGIGRADSSSHISVCSEGGISVGGGHMGDYAQYLGLQPSANFKCYKCLVVSFGTLAELKQHQTVCLQEHLFTESNNHHRHQQRSFTNTNNTCRSATAAAARRSSLHSDNAMDFDQAQAVERTQLAAQRQRHQQQQYRYSFQNCGGSSTASAPSTAAQQLQNDALDAMFRFTRKVYLCAACGTYYENWNLFFHMRDVHQKFICLLCLGIFPAGEKLLHHLEGKHGVRPDVYDHKEQLLASIRGKCYLMCTVCEHVFSEQDDFTAHLCENYIRPCSKCGLKFIHKPQCPVAAAATAAEHRNAAGGEASVGGRSRREKSGRPKNRLPLAAAVAGADVAAGPSNGAVTTTAVVPADAGNAMAAEPSSAAHNSSNGAGNGCGGLNFSSMFANNNAALAMNGTFQQPMTAAFASLELPHNLMQSNASTASTSTTTTKDRHTGSSIDVAAPREPSLFGMLNAAAAAASSKSGSSNNGKVWLPSDSIFSHPSITQHQQQQPSFSVGKNMQLCHPQQQPAMQQRGNSNISIIPGSEDYLDNRDMDIINSYINDFDTFSHRQLQQQTTAGPASLIVPEPIVLPVVRNPLLLPPPSHQQQQINVPSIPVHQSLGKSIGFVSSQQPPTATDETGAELQSQATGNSIETTATTQPSTGKNMNYVNDQQKRSITNTTAATATKGKRMDYAQSSPDDDCQTVVDAPVAAAATDVTAPPRLVPKLKLKLGNNFHSTKVDSDDDDDDEESSSESDDDDDDEDGEDDDDEEEEAKVNNVLATANPPSQPIPVTNNVVVTTDATTAIAAPPPLYTMHAPLPISPLGSFAASASVAASTPPHMHRSIADSDMLVDVEQTSEMAVEDEHQPQQQHHDIESQQHNRRQQHLDFAFDSHLQNQPQQHQLRTLNVEAEDEDVNIEDEDKDSSMEIEPHHTAAPLTQVCPSPKPMLPLVQPLPPPQTTHHRQIHPMPAAITVAPVSALPLVPFDGIVVASADDTPIFDLLLPAPLPIMSVRDLLRLCVRVAFPHCLYCNHARRIAVNGHHLARHMLAQHRFQATNRAEESSYPCAAIVNRLKAALESLRQTHFNMDTYDAADPDNNRLLAKQFECYQCRFPARHHKDLYLHNRKMHMKTVVLCLMCKNNFYSHSELSGHICPGFAQLPPVVGDGASAAAVEPVEILFRCPLCPMDRIPSGFRLMVHLRKKHGACDVCLEPCADQARLSAHVCKHKLNHLCYRCGISYRNKADITKHLFWKHGTESQQCKRCTQKKWPHVYHFCVPPAAFACDVCGSSFRRAVALRVHRRLHSDMQKYPCSEDGCEKKFISRKLLLKHVARHNAPPEVPTEVIKAESAAGEANVRPNESTVKDATSVGTLTTRDAKSTSDSRAKSATPPPTKPKPLIDIITALRAPNLSESDSSDESDHEQRPSRPTSNGPPAAAAAGTETPANADADAAKPLPSTGPDDSTTHVAGIWENFKTYQANQNKPTSAGNEAPATVAVEDPLLATLMPPPAPPITIHVSQSDHDYCVMYRSVMAAAVEAQAQRSRVVVPMIVKIKEEPADDYEPAVLQSPPAADALVAAAASASAPAVVAPSRKNAKPANVNKSPKKGRSPKKALDKSSGSSGSSSDDSDSSCSCGSNCSCSSGSSSSGDSDSSSSSSSSADSSGSERRRKRAARQKQKELAVVKLGGVVATATAPAATPSQIPPDDPPIDVGTKSVGPATVIAPPPPPSAPPRRTNDPDQIIRESDLETDESDTDEDFYDEHPQRLAANLLLQKRQQLLAVASASVGQPSLGNFDIIENSRPSTPSLPPAEDTPMQTAFMSPPSHGDGAVAPGSVTKSASRRQKLKKRKRDRKNNCKQPTMVAASMVAAAAATVPALKFNYVAAMAMATTVVQPDLPPPPAPVSLLHHQPTISALPHHMIGAPSTSASLPVAPVHHNAVAPVVPLNIPAHNAAHLRNVPRLSTGSATSCSDAEAGATPLKRSKRRRIPNKFYGYTSDEDTPATTPNSHSGGAGSGGGGLASLAHSFAMADAFKPQPPPQLTWCKEDLPQTPTRIRTPPSQPPLKTVIKIPRATPTMATAMSSPSLVGSAVAQPPIPPIIIRPNRPSQQPLVVEPLRVPNVPVHHIAALPYQQQHSPFGFGSASSVSQPSFTTAVTADSSDSDGDSSNEGNGQLQILQTPPAMLMHPNHHTATAASVLSAPNTPLTFGMATVGGGGLGPGMRAAHSTPKGRAAALLNNSGSAGTPPTGRKRASKASTAAASKAKRQARNMPKTPAIPARFQNPPLQQQQHQQHQQLQPQPQPQQHHQPPTNLQPFQRPAISQLVTTQQHHHPQTIATAAAATSAASVAIVPPLSLSSVANQIRYPIMPPAGCRPAQPGESVYCYCRCPYDEVSEMIACDGDNCPIEWFHFECVNIMVPPKGTWYCPQCRPKYAHVLEQQLQQQTLETAGMM